ncbi:MAG: histidinol-phosphate transaminase [Actinobacteria bacterium]|nr:histidinol-phosphate transaminase [Actinomycetota bacterium]
MSDRVPVRDDLRDVTPYGAPQLDVHVRLNTNETAEPPPPAYLSAVAEGIQQLQLHRYPDRPATALRTAIAGIEGLTTDRVWTANGSNEILLQLFQAYGGPGRRLLLFRPGYSAHPLIARVANTDAVEHDLPDDFRLTEAVATEAVARHRPALVCIANPNNPSGVPTSLAAVRALHDAGDALVVIDEAYVEFGGVSARELLDELPRLVVSRTFSKAYRLAGLRLGYLLAHDWVIDDLRKVRLPYHLDAVKQVAGLAALDMREQLLDHVPRVSAERDRVAAALGQLPGVEVWPSTGNFLLFRTPVDGLFDRLLERGVLVRDFSTRPRLEGCLRVTIGTPYENDVFLEAVRALVAG